MGSDDCDGRSFLSSTSDDLKDDCRPDAINAIRVGMGVEEATETWVADHRAAVAVVRDKIERSCSHYIGIFAYRRGWKPRGLRKSITEAEYDWAVAAEKPMAVFIPNVASSFAARLRGRAKQSRYASAEQRRFLKKVDKNGARALFISSADLACKITRVVLAWNGRSLLEIAGANARGLVPKSRPHSSEILALGRTRQVRAFEDTLRSSAVRTPPGHACVVVHGPEGAGQREMAARLRLTVEERLACQPRTVSVAVPFWDRSLHGLLNHIGHNIESGWVPRTARDLAGRCRVILRRTDLFFELGDAHVLDGGLPALIDGLWRPLVSALPHDLSHRLIWVLRTDCCNLPEWAGVTSRLHWKRPARSTLAVQLSCLNSNLSLVTRSCTGQLAGVVRLMQGCLPTVSSSSLRSARRRCTRDWTTI